MLRTGLELQGPLLSRTWLVSAAHATVHHSDRYTYLVVLPGLVSTAYIGHLLSCVACDMF